MIEGYTPDRLEELFEEFSKACKKYRECIYQKLLFEARSKDFLAALKHKLTSEETKSDAELERIARSSEEWQAFRKEQMDLLKESGRREIDYREAEMKLEIARSILAMRRAEIQKMPT